MRDCHPIRVYGKEISEKETTKVQGITLDWRAHIAALKGEILRALNVLRVFSSVNFVPDRKMLQRLYWAIGKSKLDYV